MHDLRTIIDDKQPLLSLIGEHDIDNSKQLTWYGT